VQVDPDHIAAQGVVGFVRMGRLSQEAGITRMAVVIKYVFFVKVVHNNYKDFPSIDLV
jgi:hypothetical protein